MSIVGTGAAPSKPERVGAWPGSPACPGAGTGSGLAPPWRPLSDLMGGSEGHASCRAGSEIHLQAFLFHPNR